jgi:putative copper resistance protein D
MDRVTERSARARVAASGEVAAAAPMTSSSAGRGCAAPAAVAQSAGSVRFAGLWRGASSYLALVVGAGLVVAVVASGITDPPAVPGFTPGPIVRYGIPLARLLLDVGAAAAVGLALVPKLLGFDQPERTEPVIAPSRRWAARACALWVVAALASIVLLTAELNPGTIVTPGAIWAYITSIAAGKGLLLSAACAALAWWFARLSLRHGERVPAELRVGIALFGLLPLPLTGHASNWYYHDLSMVSMELHVTGSAAWAGGLAVLVVLLARHRDLLAVALPRFSKLATWCVVIVGLSGVANGLLELYLSPITTLPTSLWETRYGVLLLAKAALLAAVAVMALHVRQRIMPAVAAGRRTAFAAWCGWEVGVLTVAFAVAVVLTRAEVVPF